MRELVSITGCDSFAMLIRGYIDDSADQKQETIAVAGAFLGEWKQWQKLVSPWRKRLKAAEMEYFKYSDYQSLHGQFVRFRDKELYPIPKGREAATAIRDDFESIIRNSGIRGIAHCIPLKVYQEVRNTNPLAAKVFPKYAFEAALQSLIRDCAKEFQKYYGDRHRLAFMCDEGPESAAIVNAYRGFKRLNPDIADLVGAITFGDDKKYPQLQAADLMAGIGREIGLQRLTEGSVVAGHRLSSSIYFVRSWSEENMYDTLRSTINSVSHGL
jgi:hypothetical protein